MLNKGVLSIALRRSKGLTGLAAEYLFIATSVSSRQNPNTFPSSPQPQDSPTAPTQPPPNATLKSWLAHSTIKSSDLGEVSRRKQGRRGLVLISSSLNNNIWVGKVAFPRGEDLHCAGFELGDQRLRGQVYERV